MAKKNAWGVQKIQQKSMAPYKKDEQKQHKKESRGDEPSIGRPKYGGVLEKMVVSRVRMSS
jgi:hypothetical protein